MRQVGALSPGVRLVSLTTPGGTPVNIHEDSKSPALVEVLGDFREEPTPAYEAWLEFIQAARFMAADARTHGLWHAKAVWSQLVEDTVEKLVIEILYRDPHLDWRALADHLYDTAEGIAAEYSAA